MLENYTYRERILSIRYASRIQLRIWLTVSKVSKVPKRNANGMERPGGHTAGGPSRRAQQSSADRAKPLLLPWMALKVSIHSILVRSGISVTTLCTCTAHSIRQVLTIFSTANCSPTRTFMRCLIPISRLLITRYKLVLIGSSSKRKQPQCAWIFS